MIQKQYTQGKTHVCVHVANHPTSYDSTHFLIACYVSGTVAAWPTPPNPANNPMMNYPHFTYEEKVAHKCK